MQLLERPRFVVDGNNDADHANYEPGPDERKRATHGGARGAHRATFRITEAAADSHRRRIAADLRSRGFSRHGWRAATSWDALNKPAPSPPLRSE
jgi:hypothetical protein